MTEIVDGATDNDAFARISSEVMRWSRTVPESVGHFRAALPSFRNWLAIVDGEPVGSGMCVELPDMKESLGHEALGLAVRFYVLRA